MSEQVQEQNPKVPEPARPRKKKRVWPAALVFAIAGGALMFLAVGGLGENLVYYWGPTELREAGARAMGATVRLGGQVETGSIQFEEGGTTLRFNVTDGKTSVPVLSRGFPPQMFRETIGVVVEGSLGADGVFQSARLMISHDNQYRPPEEGHPEVTDLMKTVVDPSTTETR